MESERIGATPTSTDWWFASRMLAVEAALPALQQALADRTSALPSAEEGTDATTGSAFEHFYLAFENRYRGTRQEIASRQKTYLPFLETLGVLGAGQRTGARLADLGCGRGEWLQLIVDAGASGAVGVDRSAMMIELCRQRGLPVEQADALDFLRRRRIDPWPPLHGVAPRGAPPFSCPARCSRRGATGAGAPQACSSWRRPIAAICSSRARTSTWTQPIVPRSLPAPVFFGRTCRLQNQKALLLHPYTSEHRVADSSALADRFNDFFYGPQDYAVVAYNA